MKLVSDMHTHTFFSHGKGSIEDNVCHAKLRGLKKIGIADHGPAHTFFGIKRRDIPVMRAEINRLRPIYPDMEILLGVEANVVFSDNGMDISEDEKKLFDFIMVGYHKGAWNIKPPRSFTYSLGNMFGFSSEEKNTEFVKRAIKRNDIYALTHPGDMLKIDILEIARTCAEYGTLFELNDAHGGITSEELKTIAEKTEVNFILGSDAHVPGRVGEVSSAIKLLQSANINTERIINLKQ